MHFLISVFMLNLDFFKVKMANQCTQVWRRDQGQTSLLESLVSTWLTVTKFP